jgi:hypothetical protein
MQKILLISGKKQSGKSSLCNFLHGYEMLRNNVISAFDIGDNGELLVNTRAVDADGHIQEGVGILDIERKDFEFQQYAMDNIWKYIKVYSFADSLKMFAIQHFGLSYKQCYGTDEDKNTNTSVKFSDISFAMPPIMVGERKKNGTYNKLLSAREFLQLFGSDICRRIFESCWSKPIIDQILVEQAPLAIISDVRFISEIEMPRAFGAKVIRLLRNKYEDGHSSENELDNYTDFDAVIDNNKLTMKEKNHQVFNLLRSWGWIQGEL